MGDSEDSEIDVCTIDEESSRNLHTGLTLVAAETFISSNNNEQETDVVPLSEKDLLCRPKKIKYVKPILKESTQKSKSTIKSDKRIKSLDSSEQTNKEESLKLNVNSSVSLKELEINKEFIENNGGIFTTTADELMNEETKEYDSEEELFDSGESNYLNQFTFESDHLAIKNNADYHILLRSLAVLEAQQIQAIKDLEKLHKLKSVALADPLRFVENLQEKKGPDFPKRQVISNVPVINWQHYMTAYSGNKYVPQMATRKTLKAQEQAIVSEPYLQDESSMDSISSAADTAIKTKFKGDEKHATFNQKWTVEEQEKLEKLLIMFPPEEVEARRWEKIAKALGNRTASQVSSRIQKFFIKLAKAKLPIPGRGPSATQIHQMKKAKINPINYKNSTFFPSWQPGVFMDEDDDGDKFQDSSSQCFLDNSDDEMISDDLKATPEYKELIELKRLKKQSMHLKEQEQCSSVVHNGFMCDGCKASPIIGVRWHCSYCVHSIDFCSTCAQMGITTDSHTKDHDLTPLDEVTESSLLDNDYISFEQHNKMKYNYLDPNFLPDGKIS